MGREEQIEEMAEKMQKCYEKNGLLNFKWFAEPFITQATARPLFDDTTITGILTRAKWKPDRYEIANYSFRKTHVKKIEVVR